MRALSNPAPLSGSAHGEPGAGSAAQSGLRVRIEELAAVTDNVGAQAAMDQILAEIDGIMLPREVTVFCGATAVARLVISQRRLVGLALANGWRGDLFDGVRRLLTQCDGQDLRFQRHVAQAPIGAESLSAEMIRARLWSTAENGPARWQQFQNDIAAHTLAWLEISGDGQWRQGGALQDQALLEHLAQRMQGPEGVGVKAQASILPVTRADQNLLVARAGRMRSLALIRAPAMAEVAALWQRVFDSA
ncbi:hypothetical protein KMP13_17750 [Epibacterium ulvae]|uniref:hypothetical protein n=1 Tax=Epibacterium ulvae TaxID=1156985 RepID=UPI001BFC3290|nr:hypothetical protein [Epibacterium ulvae]MBT8155673.1 hypothetical protein [Epibacterium ulvae]